MANDLTLFTEDEKIQRLVLQGDLGALTQDQKARYVVMLCQQYGLDWKSKPFDFITPQGKTILYANRNCFDQLRALHKVSVKILERVQTDQVFYVRAYAELPDGRCDESLGAIGIAGLKGEALANAMMKAETKGKRRVTQSIVGLSLPDETEVETIPGAQGLLQAPRRINPEPAPGVGSVKVLEPPVDAQVVPVEAGAVPVARAVPKKLPPAVAPVAVKP